jgi:hypothetical protein
MKTLVTATAALILSCAAVWAQASTAQMNGTVRDASGLAVPDATVKVTQTATGLVRVTMSGPDGGYVLTNLPVGPYLMEISKDGFSKYVQSGIVLQVDSNPTLDAVLKVGSVTEQVMVQADAAMVETHSTGVGQVVDNQRVLEMPLNGRNPVELVFLAGMANYPGNGAINTVRNYPTVVVSVAGGQGNGLTYLLDGANYQDPYNNLSLPLPFPDALQEFKVETSALPAQYGFHAAAAVNAVTKSGTNQFHGDLFEFVRNGDFNARDFFASSRDTLKRNQYGGTFGGPVKKDKLFFFVGYQDTTQRSAPALQSAFIPTADMLAGDFSAVAGPACNGGLQVNLKSTPGFTFTKNHIDPLSLNSVAVNLTKTLPQTADPCGKTIFGYVQGQDENLGVVKIDYRVSSKNSLFGRYTVANLNQPSTYDGKNPLSKNTYAIHDLDYSYALGDTYLIGSSVVSSFRFALNRTNIAKIPDAYKSLADFGANITPLAGHDAFMTMNNGGFNIGSVSAVPGESHNGPNLSVNEDISWVRGRHQIGFGGSIYRQMMNYWSGLNAMGQPNFNGAVTGLTLADFLTGQTNTFGQGLTYGFYNRQYYAALYAQDSWKLSSRLTLNYGVRWEPYTAPWSKTGQFSHFDPNLFASGVHSSVFVNAPAGLVFPGDSQYACGKSLNCPQWAKFFPRIGMVWDPTGSGKMTIRAAYGMFGDRNHMFYSNFVSQYAPFGGSISLSNPGLTDPWAAYQGGNPIPALAVANGIGHASHTAAFPLAGPYLRYPQNDYQAPYMNQWNLSVQRQVGRDWLLTVNYIGNNQIHMSTSSLLNPAVYLGPGSTTRNQQQRRVFSRLNPDQGQYYAAIASADTGATGTYDAFYAAVQKRLSRGISILANYTWSHCISDIQDQQTSATATIPSIPGDRRAYRGNCTGIDLRHLFILNMVATTPRFSNKIVRAVASDWQVAPILEIKSAQFYTVTSGTDVALSTASGQTPNLIAGVSPYAASSSCSPAPCIQSTSRAAFVPINLMTPGTYGNLGYNNLKGPGVFQLNLALSKTFQVAERKSFQLRAEAFNLPNRLNPSTPGANGTTSLASPTFGQITSDISGNNGLTNSGDPRIIQLAAKFVF